MRLLIFTLLVAFANQSNAEDSQLVGIGTLKRKINGMEVFVRGKSYDVVTKKCYTCWNSDKNQFVGWVDEVVVNNLSHLATGQVQCVEKAIREIESALMSPVTREKLRTLSIEDFDINFKYHYWNSQHYQGRSANDSDVAISLSRWGKRIRVEIIAAASSQDKEMPWG